MNGTGYGFARGALMSGVAIVGLASASPALAQTRNFNVPGQPAATGVAQFARQADLQLLISARDAQGRRTHEVRGAMTVEEGLRRLLAGTGLSPQPRGPSTYSIVAAPGEEVAGGAAADNEDAENREIVVTGTTIRGSRVASPVVTITGQEMRQQGFRDLGEVARALPQNYAGGQNPTIGLGSTGSNANFTGTAGLNLRGLGADATLTLLNGARLPYDGTIQAIDVTSIPVAAIDRMEILLDGASAIYGSDAVAGVANIILRRDFEGLELTGRLGVATEGGFGQRQASAVGGTHWGSGGFLLTGDVSRNGAVLASQRDFARGLWNRRATIYPRVRQVSTLFSGHQSFAEVAELSVDAFYTDRRTADVTQTSIIFDTKRNSRIWDIAPSLRVRLPHDWSVRLDGSIGENKNHNILRAFNVATGAEQVVASPDTVYRNRARAASLGAEGPLFDLPGGAARLSVGGGYRWAQLVQRQVVAGTTVLAGSARSYHVYGEVNLPIVSPDEAIPLLSRLSVNGALRYEDYNIFGNVTTPKIGAIWSPVEGLDFKASWGRSFKVPTLTQRFQNGSILLYPGILLGQPAGTVAMLASGGSRNLMPERASVLTLGFVATPHFLPGFSLELNYFDIQYDQRVVAPIANVTQANAPQYADFVTFHPNVEQQNAVFAAAGVPVGTFTLNATGQPYNPAAIHVLINNLYANATSDTSRGVDLIARYAADAFGGRLLLSLNGNWIDAKRKLSAAAPPFPASGDIFFPADFKARGGASWTANGLTLAGYVNHIAGVRNTNLAAAPRTRSMTTFDFIFDAKIDAGAAGPFTFNLAVINAFNQDPPFIKASQLFYPPYDSTNYSTMGRTVSVTVSKRF